MGVLDWLEWAEISLLKGRGGVEVHSRSIARILKNEKKYNVEISSRKNDLYIKKWNVVRTHGSSFPLFFKRPKTEVWIHTLHGTTIGRMSACKEFFWVRGYFAALREFITALRCDLLFTVNDKLWIYKLCRILGKNTFFSLSGWDTLDGESEEGEFALNKLPENYFVYIGRGGDSVKGVSLINDILKENKNIKLVAIPGDGFIKNEQIIQTGPLNSIQLKNILSQSQGLLLSSYYEGGGCPIVVSEALSLGVSVYSTNVGLLMKLKNSVKGLFVFNTRKEFFNFFMNNPKLTKQNLENIAINQNILPQWSQIVNHLLTAINKMSYKNE